MKQLLILNTGSSSVKFRLLEMAGDMKLVAGGKISGIGSQPLFKAHTAAGDVIDRDLPADTLHEESVRLILSWLGDRDMAVRQITAAAHRIVHGGAHYAEPALLTAEALAYLHTLEPLAPLHQPHNLAGVEILSALMPGAAQYGCFDTAFHARHAPLFHSFALPAFLREKGVRRYGFHGLSYSWIAQRLAQDFPHLAQGRVVAAHLGNGASLCAIKAGESIDTTMGLTALDGLPMGTRSGAIDPGAVLHMQRTLGYSPEEMEKILYEESGLKGLSGISNDVKTLIEADSEEARFALDYFVLRTAQYIASLAVSLGGLDALIFTGGIGENAPGVRAAIQERLSFLPAFETHVIPADEERGMAHSIRTSFPEAWR